MEPRTNKPETSIKKAKMIYGYLRVSSDVQDVNSQRQGVDSFAKHKGWIIDQYISDEGVSGGKDPAKRKLGKVLESLKKNDIIIASEISRLGRDLYMVMDILHHCMKVGCIVYTVKDKFVLGDDIQSKVLAFAFGLSAEIERQMIRQRTKEGLRMRMSMGVLVGRPIGKLCCNSKLEPYKDEILKAMDWGASINKVAKKLNVNPNTVWAHLMKWEYKNYDCKAYQKYVESVRKNTKKNRKCSYKDTPYLVVELPREQVIEWIKQDLTIPQIHERLPNFTYEQIYDTFTSDYEYNTLYREHAQKKLVKSKVRINRN